MRGWFEVGMLAGKMTHPSFWMLLKGNKTPTANPQKINALAQTPVSLGERGRGLCYRCREISEDGWEVDKVVKRTVPRPRCLF